MMMERLVLMLTVLTCSPWMLLVSCDGEIGPLIERMDDFDHQLVRVKQDMTQFEERVHSKMDVSKISLRSELKQDLRKLVREVLDEILQGESIGEMLESQIISDVRHLQKENKEMRKLLTGVQRGQYVSQESLLKSEREAMEAKYCSSYILEARALQGNLNQCILDKAKRDNEIHRLQQRISAVNNTLTAQPNETEMATALNNCTDSLVKMATAFGNISNSFVDYNMEIEASRRQIGEKDQLIGELRRSLCLVNESCQGQPDDSYTTSERSVSISSASATTSLLTTTTKPEEAKSRMLIVPLWSQTAQLFKQMNLHDDSLDNYNNNDIKRVTSLLYVSKIRRLLFCLFHPNKIVSTSLDSSDVITLIEDVCAYDMAVDEDTETVFLATCDPVYSISRMSIRGQDFTAVVNLTQYGKLVSAVAVNPREQQIFACSENQLFLISYDGEIIQTFSIGGGALAMTLDIDGWNVYYNNVKTLMKLSLSTNITTEVASLGAIPWNFRFYKDTVYFSTTGSSIGVIGAVNVSAGVEPTASHLQTIRMEGSSTFSICLVP